jgi:hypothetical protein
MREICRKARFRAVLIVLSGAMLGACLLPAASALAQDGTLIIHGVPVSVEEDSVKCDLGPIEGVSARRLVDCDSATVITLPDHTGSKVVKFEIDPQDEQISQGTRAELRDMYEAVNGEEVWYRFSTLLPRDMPKETSYRVVLAQWHERVKPGGASLRPPLAHRLIDGDFIVTLWNQDVHDRTAGRGDGTILYREPKLELGVIHDYVYRVLWSPDARGRVTAWTRIRRCSVMTMACRPEPWRLMILYEGAVGYPDMVGYYFKIGLYTTTIFHEPLVAFHAGYDRGPTAAAIEAPALVPPH